MKKCPACNTQDIKENDFYCYNCGYSFIKNESLNDPSKNNINRNDNPNNLIDKIKAKDNIIEELENDIRELQDIINLQKKKIKKQKSTKKGVIDGLKKELEELEKIIGKKNLKEDQKENQDDDENEKKVDISDLDFKLE